MLKVNWRFLWVLIFFQKGIYAQNQETILVRDFESWNSIGIAYKPSKNWLFELDEQLRLKENASVINAYFTEFETKYSVTNHWSFTGGFRYIRENDNKGKNQGYKSLYRYQFDLKYQHDIKRFTLGYRSYHLLYCAGIGG